jgi:LPXTG-motif cell wall-anchored protein
MKTTNVIYIVGATVLVGGGAYLFLKNKKKKDLAKLDILNPTTSTGTTSTGGTTGGTTTSDGVNPSDANLNLANATVLVGQRAMLVSTMKGVCVRKPTDWNDSRDPNYDECYRAKFSAKAQLPILDSQLAKLGYKLDAIGQLVKI